jgi:serine phosphatase RsbU (regulator of sigma subunit)
MVNELEDLYEGLEKKVIERTLELRHQKEIVEEKQKEIIDSINYAKRLQDAILPPKKLIDDHLKENFVLFKPKDIVAGDFYWAEKIGDYFFIAAADCTGHGVPGAMVSVVCSNALNRSVKEFGMLETGKILDKTTDLVLETFEKSGEDVKDGMDISLLAVKFRARTKNESGRKSENENESGRAIESITWSGANNPLWYLENGEMKELKADKQPIGKSDHRKPFTTHSLPLSISSLFLFTDGYADQFGGIKGKKFKYKPFMELLLNYSKLTMAEQKNKLDDAIENWKGDIEQNDDICIIGVRI